MSIAAFGRYYMQKVINLAKDLGFDVIYGDTDSLFIADCEEENARKLLDSVNQVADLKPGATALLTARLGAREVVVIAVLPFGKGKVLGIASNTLWKWATQPEPLRAAYGLFWRQAIRHLTGKSEGGQNLAVSFDKDYYRPGEQALGEIRVTTANAEALRATITKERATFWSRSRNELWEKGATSGNSMTSCPGRGR